MKVADNEPKEGETFQYKQRRKIVRLEGEVSYRRKDQIVRSSNGG